MRTLWMHRQLTLASLGATLLIASAASADVDADALRIHAATPDGIFGIASAALGDVDADGVRDYSISAPGVAIGRVQVYSGATGAVLLDLSRPGLVNFFGYAVADMGDVDRDGHDDLAISTPIELIGVAIEGFVGLYSGATGDALWEIEYEQEAEGFGWSLAACADVTGDGVRDLAIASPFWDAGPTMNVGRVLLVSGASGLTIGQWNGALADANAGLSMAAIESTESQAVHLALGCPGVDRVIRLELPGMTLTDQFNGQAGSEFGMAMAAMPDIDSDGMQDLIVGSPHYRSGTNEIGAATALSGADLRVRWQTRGEDRSKLGCSVSVAPDHDHDGVRDVCVGARGFKVYGTRVGRVQVLEAHTGATLKTIHGSPPHTSFGASVVGLDDLNGDGVEELLVSRESSSTDPGAGYIFSGDISPFGALQSVAAASFPPDARGRVILGDLDNNRAWDMLTIDTANNRVGVRMNTGDAAFVEPIWINVGRAPVDAVCCDLDNDGDQDLVVALKQDNALVVYWNRLGMLRRSGVIHVGREPVAVIATDFDGDFLMDLAVAHRRDKTITVLAHRPLYGEPLYRRFQAVTTLPVSFAPSRLLSARLNDGRADLLAVSMDSGVAAAFLNHNVFGFSGEILSDLHAAALPLTDLAIGDFDGDTLADLAIADGISSAPAIHAGRGNGRFQPATSTHDVGGAVRALAAAHFDGNKHTDLVCATTEGSAAIVWMLPDDPPLISVVDGQVDPRRILCGDVDRDGDRDALIIGAGGGVTAVRSLLVDP